MQAAILTIGNEVTSGQIINTNSAWLGQRLEEFKIETTHQLSVRDVPQDIKQALDYLHQHASFVFVTGGLGPTRDDLTRRTISEWLNCPLQYDENSWQHILDIFSKTERIPAETNKQQCYFPSGSSILTNAAGTANAFYWQSESLNLWCLPGPPSELQTIWQDHIKTQLSELRESFSDSQSLFRWQCLGQSESTLGEIVEEITLGSSLTTGYRPHVPYVEIKIWCPDKDLSKNMSLMKKLDEALEPWLVCKDDQDIASILVDQLSKFDQVKVIDYASDGMLTSRLGQAQKNSSSALVSTIVTEFDRSSALCSITQQTLDIAEPEFLYLVISRHDEASSWDVGISYNGFQYRTEISPRYRMSVKSERFYKHQTESALIWWHEILNSRKSDFS